MKNYIINSAIFMLIVFLGACVDNKWDDWIPFFAIGYAGLLGITFTYVTGDTFYKPILEFFARRQLHDKR